MKRIATLIILAVAVATGARAGEGDTYVSLNAGLMYPRVLNITASYQMEKAYGHAIELYIDYQTQWNYCPTCGKVCTDSFWKSRYSYAIGAAYKYTLRKGKNTATRLRVGGDLGGSNRRFAASLEGGLEYAVTLPGRMQLVLTQKNEIMFWGKPTWKAGALIGVRMPL